MITSARDCFLGIHITQTLKDALKAEAHRQGVAGSKSPSVSALCADILEEEMKARGYDLTVSLVDDRNVPLPFGEDGMGASYKE